MARSSVRRYKENRTKRFQHFTGRKPTWHQMYCNDAFENAGYVAVQLDDEDMVNQAYSRLQEEWLQELIPHRHWVYDGVMTFHFSTEHHAIMFRLNIT